MHLKLGKVSLFLVYCNVEMVKLWMQPIAQVVEASLEDYEQGLKACEEAAKVWMQVK